jgi:quinol monooxygenase YgiN
VLCLCASIATGCAGGAAETVAAPAAVVPAAAIGDPAAELSPEGAAVTALPPPEPEDDPPAASSQKVALPMFGAAVIHKVKDFDTWKSVFDADLDARKRAGFVAQGIMRGVDNDRLVMIWLAVTEVAKAKTFFSDKALRAQMKSAGVDGKPVIHVWSNVDAKMDPGRRGLAAALLVLHIDDIGEFKIAFDASAAAREQAGIVGYGLSQDVDDKGIAYVYLQSEDAAKLKAYVAGKQTRQTWRDAGMTGAPTMIVVREGDMMTYQ